MTYYSDEFPPIIVNERRFVGFTRRTRPGERDLHIWQSHFCPLIPDPGEIGTHTHVHFMDDQLFEIKRISIFVMSINSGWRRVDIQFNYMHLVPT